MTVGNEHDDEVISHNIELPFLWSTYTLVIVRLALRSVIRILNWL